MTLRYFATGSFLVVCGDFVGVHKSTASRTITRVSRAIARLCSKFIRFPETEEEISVTRQEFYAKCKFPRCIGVIDCTHIKIRSPGGEDAEIYRNRKQYFSFNVQAICNSNLKFMNIVARWQGSAHDSTIFNNSAIRGKFERGETGDSLLIGDSGYPIRPFLLTKLSIASTRAEQLYNESIIRTRNCIERCFGVYKRRFPILTLNINVSKVESVIVATAVLHNIAIDLNELVPNISTEMENLINLSFFEQVTEEQNFRPNGANEITRNTLIRYFETM